MQIRLVFAGSVTYVSFMHVRMYVRTYVCMYVCTYVRTYVCMYVCMYVRMYVCMYTHVHNYPAAIVYLSKHMQCTMQGGE